LFSNEQGVFHGQQASRLVNDLSYLPAILGRMGLSVAEAQDELNHGYVQAVADLVKLLAAFVPKSDIPAQLDPQIATLLLQLALSRYQFSETTFDFSADLAESQCRCLGRVALGHQGCGAQRGNGGGLAMTIALLPASLASCMRYRRERTLPASY
jgi:hypothetical protein